MMFQSDQVAAAKKQKRNISAPRNGCYAGTTIDTISNYANQYYCEKMFLGQETTGFDGNYFEFKR